MQTLNQNPANPIPVFGIEHKTRPEKSSPTKKIKNEAVELWEQIAVCAYFKSAARGYAPGFELQDWLEAEAEIEASQTDSKLNS